MKFEINIVKLIGKHPKLMKLSIKLNFLKIYYVGIKDICNENPSKFRSNFTAHVAIFLKYV